MRPLVARCHLDLGRLAQRTHKRRDARHHLTTAATMCREMDMRLWLEQVEVEMGHEAKVLLAKVKDTAKPAPPQSEQPSIAVLSIPVHDSSEGRLKVLIIDDHALIREALHTVLQQLKRETVIFEASSSRQAMHIVEEHPDLNLILLDISLPDRDGFSVLSELRERHPTVAIVMLSGLDDQDRVKRAFSLGALGFIPKTTECEVMLNAIQLVLSGGIYIPSEILD